MIFKCYWRSVWYGVRHVYLESISYLPISIYLRWGEGQHALDLFDTQKECKFVTIFYELVLTNSHMWMLFILRFWCNRPWSQWGIASATEKISDQSLQLSMCRFVWFFKFIWILKNINLSVVRNFAAPIKWPSLLLVWWWAKTALTMVTGSWWWFILFMLTHTHIGLYTIEFLLLRDIRGKPSLSAVTLMFQRICGHRVKRSLPSLLTQYSSLFSI